MEIISYTVLFVYMQMTTGQEDCHCQNKSDCPTYNCTSLCDPGWSGPTCQRKNIALGGSAFQTTTDKECILTEENCTSLTANLAVDGDIRTDLKDTCARTAGSHDTPSLTVTLTGPKQINRIGLYFQNEFKYEMEDFQILVGNGTHDELCYQHDTEPSTSHIEIACGQPRFGKLVTFKLPDINRFRTLALCEIEIYECTNLWWGERCEHTCDNCFGDTSYCDHISGLCHTRGVAIDSTSTTLSSTSRSPTTSKPATQETSQRTLETTATSPPSTTPETNPTMYGSTEVTVTPRAATTSDTATHTTIDGPDMTIIAAAIGTGVGLLMIVMIIVVVCRKRRRHTETQLEKSQDDDHGVQKNSHTFMGFGHGAEPNTSNTDVQGNPTNPAESSVKPFTRPNALIAVPKADIVELPEDPDAEPISDDDMNPYYNNIPRAIPVTSLRDYVQERFDGVGFGNEFAFLPIGLDFSYEIGQSANNNPKNRYREIYAYDHSRVLLKRGKREDIENTDYINASYMNGYKSPKRFIATQGPIPETVDDFWLMVWQQKTLKILMLTNIYEQKKKKCEKYWPPEGEAGNYGIINVRLEKTKEYVDYTVRVLTLHHLGENKRRKVTQYHFTTWPDHGVPSTASLVSFWKRVRRQSTRAGGKTGPVVVHCSAGIGRTGTYIGLDYLVEEAEGEGKVNIFTAIIGMRDNRVNMIQTKGQYSFLHLALLEALHSQNTWTLASKIQAKLTRGNTVLQKEYENMQAMSSMRIPEEKKKRREATHQDENESHGNLQGNIKITHWPSYFSKKGFLNVDVFESNHTEEFWNLAYTMNALTFVAIDQDINVAIPTRKETPTKMGAFQLTLISEDDVTAGVSARKLNIHHFSGERQRYINEDGKKQVIIYCLKSTPTEQHFDKTHLLSLIDIIIDRQQQCGHHPVILQCGESSTQCSLFAAATYVISCLRLDQEVDIYLTVREIQCHKGQPVTCLADYRFLYELASEYVQSKKRTQSYKCEC